MAIDWAKELGNIKGIGANLPPGDDWFKFKEFKEKSGRGQVKAYDMLKTLRENGEIEIFHGSEYNEAHDQHFRQTWYRFKNRN